VNFIFQEEKSRIEK